MLCGCCCADWNLFTSPASLVAMTAALVLDVAALPRPSPAPAARRLRPYADFARPVDLGLDLGPAGPAGPVDSAGAVGAAGRFAADYGKGAGRDGGAFPCEADGVRGGGLVGDGQRARTHTLSLLESAGSARDRVGRGGDVAYKEMDGGLALTEVECEVRRWGRRDGCGVRWHEWG